MKNTTSHTVQRQLPSPTLVLSPNYSSITEPRTTTNVRHRLLHQQQSKHSDPDKHGITLHDNFLAQIVFFSMK